MDISSFFSFTIFFTPKISIFSRHKSTIIELILILVAAIFIFCAWFVMIRLGALLKQNKASLVRLSRNFRVLPLGKTKTKTKVN